MFRRFPRSAGHDLALPQPTSRRAVRRVLRAVLRTGLRVVIDNLDRPEPDDDWSRVLLRQELDDIQDRVEIMWRELDLDLERTPASDTDDVDTDTDTDVPAADPGHPPHPLAWTIAQALRPQPGQNYPPVGVVHQELSNTHCPSCGTPINAVTSWGDTYHPDMPKICICGVCAKPFRVDDKHTLVTLTAEEIEGLDPNTRNTMDALRQMLNQ